MSKQQQMIVNHYHIPFGVVQLSDVSETKFEQVEFEDNIDKKACENVKDVLLEDC